MIKLFLTDIDGVWTDGGIYYSNHGEELKKFNTYDSAGVLYLKKLNIPVGIITGENSEPVRQRASKLNVDYLFLGAKNKLEIASFLCESLKINLNEVAYIGDDLNDIRLLKNVGLSACPQNAPDYIKKIVDWVIPLKGGEGVFRTFVEMYLEKENLLQSCLSDYC